MSALVPEPFRLRQLVNSSPVVERPGHDDFDTYLQTVVVYLLVLHHDLAQCRGPNIDATQLQVR
ncbi:MAG: hypothetical protein JRH16_16570 [Deltaproteobacteria bacterium]|nr:hypothetical protein [Deltaproteobacteria bacterium]